jgi:ribosome-associated toxin RatA of RatAB toxin-antitoxin module
MDLRIEEAIDQPYALVLQAMLGDPGKWLPGLARDAADRLVTDLAVRVGNVRAARSVEVDVTPPTIYPDRCEICVAWKAAQDAALFPELTGTFKLEHMGPAQSRLSFEATYEPPASVLGQLVDRTFMHRTADVSVREFVLRTARMLESRAASLSAPSTDRRDETETQQGDALG